ncbi:hypothetical protein [Alkalibacterium sp. s-m-22]
MYLKKKSGRSSEASRKQRVSHLSAQLIPLRDIIRTEKRADPSTLMNRLFSMQG